MSKNSKTKQGMASIYIVVFTTLLISIITLSFLRIMLSESGRTSRDTLSDSAYNSALAGIEDAKTAYSLYQKALAGDNSNEAKRAKDVLEAKDQPDRYQPENDCDLVRKALGGTSSSEYTIDKDITDQAYTCVSMSLEGNFAGYITKDDPVLVVPLRSKDSMKPGSNADGIKGVKIVWYNLNSGPSLKDISDGYGYSNEEDVVDGNYLSSQEAGIFGQMGMQSDDAPVDLNALNVMLVQSSKGDTDPSHYYAAASEYSQTNRGYLTLVPYDGGAITDAISIDKKAFVQSANKTMNQPIPVKCYSDNDARCEVKIDFPDPVLGGERDPENFFLVLNKLYSDPELEVQIEMYNDSGDEIKFWNVQPIVDATGRAGDLMRRVEARLGTKNGADLLPTAELSVDGNIEKNFYVTKNCIQGAAKCDDSHAK